MNTKQANGRTQDGYAGSRLLPEGRYLARAEAATVARAASGNRQVGVTFRISEGPYAGWRIAWYGGLTDRTKKHTLNGLRYCGCDVVNLGNLRGVTRNEVQLVIVHEPDLGGVMRARVRWVNRGGVPLGRGQELTPEEVAALSSELGLVDTADTAPPREASENIAPERGVAMSGDAHRAVADVDKDSRADDEDDLLPF